MLSALSTWDWTYNLSGNQGLIDQPFVSFVFVFQMAHTEDIFHTVSQNILKDLIIFIYAPM